METFAGQDWAPARFTEPLGTPMLSDGPRLVALVERHMVTPDGPLVLRPWQRALLTHLLERYPPGHRLAGQLRFRQAVVSVARQNGKSLLGAALALYGLLQHTRAPSVIGLATSVEQANVVYGRVQYAVEHSPALERRLRATGTRGVTRRDKRGSYLVKPAKREGLQSVPITLAVADELHLMHPALWDSIVQGQRSKRDALVVGITTAGDETSILLQRLYRIGGLAIDGRRERFGFFVWEAPEGSSITDDAAFKAANPMVADGTYSLTTVRADVLDQPRADQQRYALNRFPDAAAARAWWDGDEWNKAARSAPLDQDAPLIIAVAREPGWSAATITAAQRTDTGAHVEVIATLASPTTDLLHTILGHLAERHRAQFVMDSATLGALGKRLRDEGHDTWILATSELVEVAAALFAGIMKGRFTHDGHHLTTSQWATTERHTVGDAWRLATTRGSDATRASAMALWLVAERTSEDTRQLF